MKKLLVISNGCFSLTDSNGRTLEKLLKDYDPENLAQVFTYGTPDFDMCENYYRVTDKDVIKALFKGKAYLTKRLKIFESFWLFCFI